VFLAGHVDEVGPSIVETVSIPVVTDHVCRCVCDHAVHLAVGGAPGCGKDAVGVICFMVADRPPGPAIEPVVVLVVH